MTRPIGILIGSLRKDSLNRRLAQALTGLAPAELKLEVIEIGALPSYNPDDEKALPASIAEFRRQVKATDGVLFVTPEYNRGVPGLLKNAIDIGSRPYGGSAWSGKPAGVISLSPGALGAFGANHQLRQSFVFLDMPTLQQPEAYIGNAANLFDENGQLKDDSTRQFLEKYLAAFAVWVAKHAAASAK